LEGVQVASNQAEESIVKIASLVATDRKKLLESPKFGAAAYRLFEMLPMMPRFTVERVKTALDTTFPTANAAVKALQELGLITETTGNKKNRSFSYAAYIELLTD
jgi:hypothetical protein